MAEARLVKEAIISDGKGGKKVVRPGDWVELIPSESRTYQTENDKTLHGELLNLMRETIGKKAPIKSIGQFPNGGTLLYFELENGEMGYAADDFQAV